MMTHPARRLHGLAFAHGTGHDGAWPAGASPLQNASRRGTAEAIHEFVEDGRPENDVLNEPVPRNGARLLFARTFFKNPIMLGSVIPSSRFLIKGVLEPLDLSRARVVVEYGPGVGTITRDLLERMHPDAKLVVIEMNTEFVRYLREEFRDDRLIVVEGSAADVRSVLRQHGFEHADYAISGIPLGSMPVPVREHIIRETREALAPDGAFMVYQFTSRVMPELKRVFENVKHDREWLNVLPAHLFYCTPGARKTNGAAHARA